MIWCVEDDNGIRDIEVYTLNSTGHKARGFSDGASFFEALKKEKPALVLLDIMLPGQDGVEILKKLKNSSATASVPVIMATAKGSEYDKVQSLDLGADDYLTKPFGMMELIARIHSLLRRAEMGSPELSSESITIGELHIDRERHIVRVKGENVVLTYKEFELLWLLCENR